jgi:hypothetical protein
MGRTLGAIRDRYDSVPPDQHFAAARRYGARYVVLTRDAGTPAGATLAHAVSNDRYFLYDLGADPEPGTRTVITPK